jgi:hypothetical protein
MWAGAREKMADYVERVPAFDLRRYVSDAMDGELLRKARLDCDWYAENARCFSAMQHERLAFLPAWVGGAMGLVEMAQAAREPGEERWFVSMAHQPQMLGAAAKQAFALLEKVGVRHLYYAFDEASRFMPCFPDIAPHLSVLIHDEAPLDPTGSSALSPNCLTWHRSWVANVLPFSVPFNEAPEEKILFLGSQLGLTPHRQRQIEFLQQRFRDRFVASHDHSVAVAERGALSRFKVGLCPEGRKFTTPAMAKTHTDRPFWSGCLGLVPVSEDSREGGRLQELHGAGLILRYRHGDLKALEEACERALGMPNDERRRIYEHYNRNETIGTVVAEAIAAAG